MHRRIHHNAGHKIRAGIYAPANNYTFNAQELILLYYTHQSHNSKRVGTQSMTSLAALERVIQLTIIICMHVEAMIIISNYTRAVKNVFTIFRKPV